MALVEQLPQALRLRKHRAAAANPTVPNIDVIAVGHTPGEWLRRAGNVVCIDTGACMTGGDLTVLEAGELLAGASSSS